jgi:hypothetical protein
MEGLGELHEFLWRSMDTSTIAAFFAHDISKTWSNEELRNRIKWSFCTYLMRTMVLYFSFDVRIVYRSRRDTLCDFREKTRFTGNTRTGAARRWTGL